MIIQHIHKHFQGINLIFSNNEFSQYEKEHIRKENRKRFAIRLERVVSNCKKTGFYKKNLHIKSGLTLPFKNVKCFIHIKEKSTVNYLKIVILK